MFLAVAMAVVATSCSQFKVTETEEGDRIQYLAKGEGDKTPEVGDMLKFNLRISSEQDSVFTDTWEAGRPIEIPMQPPTFTPSFESALMHLHEGDSAVVFVSADTLFTRIHQPLPPGVSVGSDLKFLVSLLSIETKEEHAAALEEKSKGEDKVIADFVGESLKGAEKFESGIYVLKEKSGSGATVAKGDTVTVNYVGKFFDGNIFDQNEGASFPVGLGYVIPGWEEALMSMKKGEKSTFVIPSKLAYGERGAGNAIPPFTPLVFEIELLKINKK